MKGLARVVAILLFVITSCADQPDYSTLFSNGDVQSDSVSTITINFLDITMGPEDVDFVIKLMRDRLSTHRSIPHQLVTFHLISAATRIDGPVDSMIYALRSRDFDAKLRGFLERIPEKLREGTVLRLANGWGQRSDVYGSLIVIENYRRKYPGAKIQAIIGSDGQQNEHHSGVNLQTEYYRHVIPQDALITQMAGGKVLILQDVSIEMLLFPQHGIDYFQLGRLQHLWTEVFTRAKTNHQITCIPSQDN